MSNKPPLNRDHHNGVPAGNIDSKNRVGHSTLHMPGAVSFVDTPPRPDATIYNNV